MDVVTEWVLPVGIEVATVVSLKHTFRKSDVLSLGGLMRKWKWLVALALLSILCAPAVAQASETRILNASFSVFNLYDQSSGWLNGQRWHFKVRVCGHGSGIYFRVTEYRSPYGQDYPIRAQVLDKFDGSHEVLCETWTLASNVTAAFKHGRLRACVRAKTSESSWSSLACRRANTS